MKYLCPSCRFKEITFRKKLLASNVNLAYCPKCKTALTKPNWYQLLTGLMVFGLSTFCAVLSALLSSLIPLGAYALLVGIHLGAGVQLVSLVPADNRRGGKLAFYITGSLALLVLAIYVFLQA